MRFGKLRQEHGCRNTDCHLNNQSNQWTHHRPESSRHRREQNGHLCRDDDREACHHGQVKACINARRCHIKDEISQITEICFDIACFVSTFASVVFTGEKWICVDKHCPKNSPHHRHRDTAKGRFSSRLGQNLSVRLDALLRAFDIALASFEHPVGFLQTLHALIVSLATSSGF